VLIIVGLIALAVGLTRWWFPRLVAHPTDTPSAKACAALWVFVWFAARTPLAAAAALFAFDALWLLTVRLEQIGEGLVAGIAAATFGYGVARGVVSPKGAPRRPLRGGDAPRPFFYKHLSWAPPAP